MHYILKCDILYKNPCSCQGEINMYKCEVFEAKNQNGEIVYGIKCGEVQQLISRNFIKVQKLTNKCNKFGIDPIHLNDVIVDAGIKL